MIVFFVDHLVVAVFRGVKTAGDPHPSGPVSAPVFPLLAFHACRRRSCSLLRSSLSSAVKVGRLVLRDSMGASKLDL